ncbi:MAG: carbonic anhydrase [Alphaproteobacteria bacterium]|nr:carbonic anhydrase [Alphaproteobacteria bacterium]MCL2758359.1 carbonic anhydrase [Alphaproteobacteria bacterium]
MSVINEIVNFNKEFVAAEKYVPYISTVIPDKKLAIVTCMDARLVELLPAALNIRNGEAKVIKNAGAMITHPDGSVMRSLLVAIYVLGVREVMVIGHTECGMKGLDLAVLTEKMGAMGVTANAAELEWMRGFEDDNEAVRASVGVIKTHPLLPEGINIRGFIMDAKTGALSEVSC